MTAIVLRVRSSPLFLALPLAGFVTAAATASAQTTRDLTAGLWSADAAGERAQTASVTELNAGQLQDCHLLYLGNLDLTRAATTVDTLNGLPVLTVSDLHGFATTAGGVIELFQENDKMRFINTRAADRLRLRLSSRLLSLATIVEDGSGAPQP